MSHNDFLIFGHSKSLYEIKHLYTYIYFSNDDNSSLFVISISKFDKLYEIFQKLTQHSN